MIGLSPRITLTALQTQTSTEITEAVPALPSTVADLISQMAVPDFSSAALELEFSSEGTIIENQRNQQIMASIELALTSPSTECDPAIKAAIFTNAWEKDQIYTSDRRILKPYLVDLIHGLHRMGWQLNLDDVELSNLNLSGPRHFDLNGMSARRATFCNVNLNYAKLEGVDFTGAKFTHTDIERARLSKAIITDATFKEVYFHHTWADEMTGNQSGIIDIHAIQPTLIGLYNERIQSDIVHLQGQAVTATPDRTPFTLPANTDRRY